jgi:uncharacterized phage-associated protein
MDTRVHFDEAKAVQVAGRLIELSGKKSMSKSKLAMLLYLVDREAIKVKGRPVIGGQYISTPHDGPLIGQTMDAMESAPDGDIEIRERSFRCAAKMVSSMQPTEYADLSKRELAIVDQVHRQYGSMPLSKMRSFMQGLPEYEVPNGSGSEIPLEQLIRFAMGKSLAAARSWVRDIAGVEALVDAHIHALAHAR